MLPLGKVFAAAAENQIRISQSCVNVIQGITAGEHAEKWSK